MRKITLLTFYFLVGSMVMLANERLIFDQSRGGFHSSEPLIFEQRGIVFYVFLNGDFDFNTHPNQGSGDFVYRRGSSALGNKPVNHGVRIQYDQFGRVRSVGNTFINYDRLNRVVRIGNVSMSYQRNGLVSIGGMTIVYDRRGNVLRTLGSIFREQNYPNDFYNNNGFSSGNYYYGPVQPNNNHVSYVYKSDGSRVPIR
jgi:hypothetical protein